MALGNSFQFSLHVGVITSKISSIYQSCKYIASTRQVSYVAANIYFDILVTGPLVPLWACLAMLIILIMDSFNIR